MPQVLRAGEGRAPELLVVVSWQPVRKDDGKRYGIDCEQAEVEQRVDVSAQQQSVADHVCVLAAVGPDVSGFQGVWRVAAANCAPASVRSHQGIPEVRLTLPRDYVPHGPG